ncbi:hypothetical protein ACFSOZ_20260 [Mesorhizobium newzealandense]|uniref:Uncharacterized protein n=1 Tax=Mesorhizobium newzealandense TaxID=1300302 RepID=A0ABW4UBE5_9HYPH
MAFATLVTHDWSNDGFLQNGKEILSLVFAIGHIPAVLIHGRRDISEPVITPGASITIGRQAACGPQSMEQMHIALDSFTTGQ